MKQTNNEKLAKYTTIQIGGEAKNFYVPENENELIDLLKSLKNEKYYILSGGSNLLMNDKSVFEHVIYMKYLDKKIVNIGDGIYTISSGVKLQSLLKHINNDGYGGIEYLYSVPGFVGGAIFMNAGRGKKHKQSISDYIIEVKAFNKLKSEVELLNKEQCSFSYRNSLFQDNNYVILEVKFKFQYITVEKGVELKNNRLKLAKENQDFSGRVFGSVFRVNNRYLMRIVRFVGLGNKRVRFSKKTQNWLIKLENNVTFDEINHLLKIVEKIHKVFFQKIEREVRIWDEKNGE
jgi:UDP-N-acetylmuramate dehydrogenase